MPLALVEDAEPQLTGVRAELAAANDALTAAIADRDAQHQPLSRLNKVIADHQRAEAQRLQLQSEYDNELGRWLADGDGPRPQPSQQLMAAEEWSRSTRASAAAAEARMEVAAAEASQSSAAVAAAAFRQKSATYRTTVEACQEFCELHLRPAIDAAMEYEATVRGVEALLWENGRRDNDNEAMSLAARLGDYLKTLRPTVAMPPNMKPAAKLLSALRTDATASLEVI